MASVNARARNGPRARQGAVSGSSAIGAEKLSGLVAPSAVLLRSMLKAGLHSAGFADWRFTVLPFVVPLPVERDGAAGNASTAAIMQGG